MTGRTGKAALAAAVLAATFAGGQAHGAEGAGWYVGGSVPVMFIDDTHTITRTVVNAAPPSEADTTTKYDAGFKLDGVLGYEFGNGWRAEGELFFAQSGVKSLTYTGITVITPQGPFTPPLSEVVVPVEGDVKQMGAAMNLWYDFNEGSKWRPYAGGGLMWVRVDQSDLDYDEQEFAQRVAESLGADPFPPGYVARVADIENVLGYHVGAGIGYEWSESITVHAGYRRQTTQELSFKGSNATSEVESTTDLRVNFFEVGLRYRF